MQRWIKPLIGWLVIQAFASLTAHAAIAQKDNLWPNDSQLNVWFLDGDPVAQHRVRQAARAWSRYANLRFEFYQQKPLQGSHIRISFTLYDGSLLGRHNDVEGTQPTLYLASLVHGNVADETKQRIALHEFGHILGLEHEFRHPHWPYGDAWRLYQQQQCETRLANVITVDDKLEHCKHINRRLNEQSSAWFPFDEQSIMNYPVDQIWLENREAPMNAILTLSALDKMAIAALYPFQSEKSNQIDLSNNELQFYNHCQSAIQIRYIESPLGLLNQQQSIWLEPRTSFNIGAPTHGRLLFKAMAANGKTRWSAVNSEHGFMDFALDSFRYSNQRFAFYCD